MSALADISNVVRHCPEKERSGCGIIGLKRYNGLPIFLLGTTCRPVLQTSWLVIAFDKTGKVVVPLDGVTIESVVISTMNAIARSLNFSIVGGFRTN